MSQNKRLLTLLAMVFLVPAACTSSTAPSTSTNAAVTNLVTLYGVTNQPVVRVRFLTGSNQVKVGLGRFLGPATFGALTEYFQISTSDLNPSAYEVLSAGTNWVATYSWWTGTQWADYVTNLLTNQYAFTNNGSYTVYLSGTWLALTNAQGAIQVGAD